MNSDAFRKRQAPFKDRYCERPEDARYTLTARGRIGDPLTCKVETGKTLVEAGLHPATGGDGLTACSGDMLLESLVACAGVTLRAVATSLGIECGVGRYGRTGRWISVARSGSRRTSPWGFRLSDCRSISIRTHHRSSSGL